MREAQLMTLQAQINPHFLFNTLNAGAQLAMMEGADKTTEFIENMADFFRYNIKKMNQDATILEEIHLVDNYIYIMNVRFTGEIHFEKEVDETVLDHVNGSWFHQLDQNNQLMGTVWPGKSDIYHALQAMLIPYRSVDLSIACAVKESERK